MSETTSPWFHAKHLRHWLKMDSRSGRGEGKKRSLLPLFFSSKAVGGGCMVVSSLADPEDGPLSKCEDRIHNPEARSSSLRHWGSIFFPSFTLSFFRRLLLLRRKAAELGVCFHLWENDQGRWGSEAKRRRRRSKRNLRRRQQPPAFVLLLLFMFLFYFCQASCCAWKEGKRRFGLLLLWP